MPRRPSPTRESRESVRSSDSRAELPALNSWDVTPSEAIAIQESLRDKVRLRDNRTKIRFVAGADAAFILPEPRSWQSGKGKAVAAMVLYRFPEMEEVEQVTAVRPLTFPYVPGLLSFREIPVLVQAFQNLRQKPDLIFCDGQGYAHPRRIGMASHLGVLLDRPTIGCAKSLLIGEYREPPSKAGNWTPLIDPGGERGGKQGETIGAVLRTADGVRPIFVSQGHCVSLPTAIRLTLAVCDGRRIPRPTRDADRLAAVAKAREQESPAAEGEGVSA